MPNAKMALLFSLFALAACKDASDDVSSDSVPVDDSGPTEVIDNDGDGVPAEEDCDDNDAAVNPSAAEACDGLDNNCDGAIDEGVGTAWYADADGDGFGDDAAETIACEPPEGAVDVGGDCDDADAAYNPGAAETDCADPNDYNCDGSVGYNDGDGDGFAACEECDDGDVAVNPNAEEICDERDNNCDGSTDEGVTSTFYQDR
ncbi:putative metal-binding motif-containing protein, partial [Myxococcota bacterium]|nr:putative metal-binding motif-containing protein [Myxococcota bacterium]